jgi:superfamily I DNA/RNA helicase
MIERAYGDADPGDRQPSARRDVSETAGRKAERLVRDRLRAAFPDSVAILENVHWRERVNGHFHDGEADLVVADPDRGILIVEVKSGEIRRAGRTWWAGNKELPQSPFEQAASSRHALVRKLRELPAWDPTLNPVAGDAVAFPDVDVASAGARLGMLGPDVDPELILDQHRLLGDPASASELRAWLDRVLEGFGRDSAARRPPGEKGVGLLVDLLEEPIELRSMLRNELAAGEREVVRLTAGQYQLLNLLKGQRRASIVGGAGTGKTMLAIEKAERLAREGYRTLLVCFNSPLARELADMTAATATDTGLLDVSTFHQLCEDLGREAGTLGPKPEPVTQAWFDVTLPDALDDAIGKVGSRYHAIVVDEGQDFATDWLASLDELLETPNEDILYVFHDPAQAIYREDCVSQLDLPEYPIELNCRNSQPIHNLVRRFGGEGLTVEALRSDGRQPEFIEAEDDDATLEALRRVLHRLRADEGVRLGEIAVLTGRSLEDSAVWRQRRFGNEVLWNGGYDDAGHSLGLAADLVPEVPPDAILFDSIRRFKGLERPIVVLVELRPDDPRLDRLLYIGASRARQHLVVIAPTAVLVRAR